MGAAPQGAPAADWLEVTVCTDTRGLDGLTAALSALGVDELVIDGEDAVNDYLQNARKAWEHLDGELLAGPPGMCRVRFYLEDSPDGARELDRLRRGLGGYLLDGRRIQGEDWGSSWREYYKPLRCGERLLIVPAWESAPEAPGRIVLRLDPKHIFGNGTHASTRLCLEALERHGGDGVLDLGCGSGILSIAALLMGFSNAVACDIVPDAPQIVRENAAFNGLDPRRLEVHTGDALDGAFLAALADGRRFDLIFANIVADVILALIPGIAPMLTPGGAFICSGIIDSREREVHGALTQAGFTVKSRGCIDNWRAFTAGL